MPSGGGSSRASSRSATPYATVDACNGDTRLAAVELGLMSTTTARETAFAYSGSRSGQRCTVLEIQVGRIDVGADISFLSQYPGEKEFLMQPLSSLEVTPPPFFDASVARNRSRRYKGGIARRSRPGAQRHVLCCPLCCPLRATMARHHYWQTAERTCEGGHGEAREVARERAHTHHNNQSTQHGSALRC